MHKLRVCYEIRRACQWQHNGACITLDQSMRKKKGEGSMHRNASHIPRPTQPKPPQLSLLLKPGHAGQTPDRERGSMREREKERERERERERDRERERCMRCRSLSTEGHRFTDPPLPTQGYVAQNSCSKQVDHKNVEKKLTRSARRTSQLCTARAWPLTGCDRRRSGCHVAKPVLWARPRIPYRAACWSEFVNWAYCLSDGRCLVLLYLDLERHHCPLTSAWIKSLQAGVVGLT